MKIKKEHLRFIIHLRKSENMKIMVCGSIGYGGIQKIKELQEFLTSEKFEVFDHISKEGMDYSNIKDFRFDRVLSERIVQHDLEFIEKADIIVVLLEGPSFGTAIEMNEAKRKGKKVISLAENDIPTPWPIFLSDRVVTSRDELSSFLNQLEESTK
ncbi:MAG: hypothetical protein HXS54_03045 [Theionarchaea archaeon]|nr:hypothetical protein [Theionarchaea archaeon]